MLIEMADCQ